MVDVPVHGHTDAAFASVCPYHQGELDLDAPVARYWPEFAATGKEAIPRG
jgi:hypothetical protein